MTQANQSKPDDDRRRSGERRSSALERSARAGSFEPITPAYLPSPFSLMSEIMRDVDRVMRDFVGSGTRIVTPPGPSRLASLAPSAFSPSVEVLEREGELVVRADLPGLERDDVQVEIEDNRIVLSGERTQRNEDQRAGYYRSEVAYGRFSRVIGLPEGARADDASATFTSGVLEITVPLEQNGSARRRRIEVKSGESGGSEQHSEEQGSENRPS